jgi:GNAT superfamily N-acetyltransferase
LAWGISRLPIRNPRIRQQRHALLSRLMNLRLASVDDAAAIAGVHVDAWRTTYMGILSAGYLAGLSYEEREKMWRDELSQVDRREFTYIVEDSDSKILGFATGGPERDGDPLYRGELQAIYLVDRHQGHGIGRRLVRTVAERLIHDGYETMLVWVLAKNSARTFYEKLGGALVKSKIVKIGQTDLEELAYGWKSLRSLLIST